MSRLLFSKEGTAIWISHLDLMRLLQRAFQRAGLPLVHTQGFNPRPSVSIALPMSVGVSSKCELLDFELESAAASFPEAEIIAKLNQALIPGIKAHCLCQSTKKVKDIAFMDCELLLSYDSKCKQDGVNAITALFQQDEITVTKKSKNGTISQNIKPMIRKIEIAFADEHDFSIKANICCQNPTLNPALIYSAIVTYLPQYAADSVHYFRQEIYDGNDQIFR